MTNLAVAFLVLAGAALLAGAAWLALLWVDYLQWRWRLRRSALGLRRARRPDRL